MAAVDLIVNIVTKMTGDGMKAAENSTSKFKSGLNKASVVAGGALAGIVAFGAGAAAAASDVQQSLGAVDAVFGKNADTVKKWADQSSTAVGLSKNAYMELATVTGAQLKNMGLPMDKVTGKTNDLIKKGADLAATFGGTTADAVGAIGAALRGETDPIERYGVSIKQADIAAQQAAEGTSKLTGAAGKQAKTMALLHLMNKQTADSTGAFGRETDTAAHASQVSAAQMEDMKASLGTALLPAITMVTAALGTLAAFMEKHATTTQIVVGVVAALAAGILALNVVITISTALTALLGEEMAATWLAALGPIGLVILAVMAVVAVVIILWKKSETFRTIVLAVWAAIQVAAQTTGAVLAAVWQRVSTAAVAVFNFLKAAWKLLISSIVGPFVAMVGLIVRQWQVISGAASKAWSVVRSGAQAVVGAVVRIWNGLQASLSSVAQHITQAFRNAWGAVQDVASNITSAIKNAFDGVKAAVSRAVQTAVSTFATLPGKVKAAFSGAASLLYGIGQDIVNGLVRGITSAAGAVASAVGHIVDAIPKFIRKKMGIASPSKVMAKIGHDIMRGLAVGMADGVAGVRKVTQAAVDAVTKTITDAAKNKKQGAALSRQAAKSLDDETAALVRNGQKRTQVYKDIATHTQLLTDLRNAWDQLSSSVRDNVQSFGSFASSAGDDFASMLADMATRVAQAEKFQQVLAGLRSMGLNTQTLTELAQAGPDALGRAQALIDAGTWGVQQVNALQARLTTAAATLGTQTADAMYKVGIDTQQALLDGLLADKARLEATAERLAQDLAAAVRKALTKYMPAKRSGKKGSGKSVASYGAPVVASSRGVGTPAPAAGGIHITVNGAVDPESTARQITRILDGHARRVGLVA